jgi:hypothetical protein
MTAQTTAKTAAKDESHKTWDASQLTDLRDYAVVAVAAMMVDHKAAGEAPTRDSVKMAGHRAWSMAVQAGVDASWARSVAACHWVLQDHPDDVVKMAAMVRAVTS